MVLKRFCQTLLFGQYLLLLPMLWIAGEGLFCLLRFGMDTLGGDTGLGQESLVMLLAFLGLGVYAIAGLFTGHLWARRPYTWFAGLLFFSLAIAYLPELGRRGAGLGAPWGVVDYLSWTLGLSVLFVGVAIYVRPGCFEALE